MPVPGLRRHLAVLIATLSTFVHAYAAVSPANDRAVENLAAFARAYGYVRFFHPTEEVASVDWIAMGMLGAEAVRNAPDDAALRTALQQFFAPVGQGLQFLTGRESASQPVPLPPDDPVAYWQHLGVQLSDQSNIYRSSRVLPDRGTTQLFDPPPALPRQLEKSLGGALRLILPLRVPAAASDPGNRAEKPPGFASLDQTLKALDLKSLTTEDWRVRVAGVVVAWNVFQHFHPYLDQAGVNWLDALRPALRRALTDGTRDDYWITLSELVAKLGDGHGYVYGRNQTLGGLPVAVAVIEGQIVVTTVAADSATGLQRGDILVQIDDVPAMELLHQRERLVAGSPHLRRLRALNQFGEGPLDSVARLAILRNGQAKAVEISRARDRRGFFFNPIAEFDLPVFAEVRPGIFHIAMHACDVATLTEKLPQLAAARGVIFDQRLSSRRGPTDRAQAIAPHQHIIPHLIDSSVQASPMLVPRVMLPDREGWTYRESTWPVQPKSPRFAGRTVFINVPSVVSYGETCMAMIAHHKLATLVGEPTAGCNGNVNFIPLPDGLRIMWTGMDVLKHDRSPFYGVGFVPDVPVKRTHAAVQASRDEFLERAIAVIEGER